VNDDPHIFVLKETRADVHANAAYTVVRTSDSRHRDAAALPVQANLPYPTYSSRKGVFSLLNQLTGST
jgi:hypothetical protein